jgi:starch phosphorylase
MSIGDPTETSKGKPDRPRTAMDVDSLKRAFADNLFFVQGRPAAMATRNDLYMALA